MCVCHPSLGSLEGEGDAQRRASQGLRQHGGLHTPPGRFKSAAAPRAHPRPVRSPFQLKGKSAREPDTEPAAPACPRREPPTRGQVSDLALAGSPSVWVRLATSLSPDVWLGLPRSPTPHLLYRLENSTERGRDFVDSKLHKQNQIKYFQKIEECTDKCTHLHPAGLKPAAGSSPRPAQAPPRRLMLAGAAGLVTVSGRGPGEGKAVSNYGSPAPPFPALGVSLIQSVPHGGLFFFSIHPVLLLHPHQIP